MYLCIKTEGFCNGCAACTKGFISDDSFTEISPRKRSPKRGRRALMGTLTGGEWYVSRGCNGGGGEDGKTH